MSRGIIEISKEEVQRCLDFAIEFKSPAQMKSGLDFGNAQLPRKVTDRIADTTLGKVGELGFQKFCQRNGLQINIDFEIKEGRHETDFGQDVAGISINGAQKSLLPLVDIKTTKPCGSWLLLENHKFWASIVVKMAVNVPKDIETNLAVFKDKLTCEFRGYAFFADFFDASGNPWFEYKEGERLLSSKAVTFMYESAAAKYGNIHKKRQLKEFYWECREKLDQDLFIGPTLKCPNQVGLPSKFLRRSKEDIEFFFKVLRSTSVPANEINNSILPAMIEWTTVLSRLNKSL